MRFAHLQPSGMIMGSINLYVVFSTKWLKATTLTSISVFFDWTAGTPYYGATFAVVDSLCKEQRRLSSTFWSAMMTLLSIVSFNGASILSARAWSWSSFYLYCLLHSATGLLPQSALSRIGVVANASMFALISNILRLSHGFTRYVVGKGWFAPTDSLALGM